MTQKKKLVGTSAKNMRLKRSTSEKPVIKNIYSDKSSNRIKNSQTIDVRTAAKLMGVTPQYVRVGMQRGFLPIGIVSKANESDTRYTYYINPKKFEEITGITL